ncbi:hypothetical protein LU11_gp273 [Pseudomonas phage Lu11]|nr:hypothetical protein LU11_gp273 [Pseudomonas phage Lu11]AFH14804.1 hypothetical protein Lu11_0267 [Pseudomonas phage Lu11]
MKNLRNIMPLLPVFALVALIGCNEPKVSKGFAAQTGHSGFAIRR